MATTGLFKYNPIRAILGVTDDSIEAIGINYPENVVATYQAGNFGGAIKLLHEVSTIIKNTRGIFLAMAFCHARMGNFDEALAQLDRELALPAPHPHARQLRNDILTRLERPEAGCKLTIFTIPKPFKGHSAIIQKNAILSWLQLRPQPEIILCGDDEGVAEVAAELGVLHIKDVAVNQYATPLLNDVFEKVQMRSQCDLMAYVNADIILFQNFVDCASYISKCGFNKYLMIGQRWDIYINKPIDFFTPGWDVNLIDTVKKYGKLHAPTGKDYFIFPKGMWGKIPEFAIGRGHFDNWLVFKSLIDLVAVIDCTTSVFCVHQDHDYDHMVGKSDNWLERPECLVNRSLAGYAACHGFTSDATWVLNYGHLQRRFNFSDVHKAISCLNEMLYSNYIPEAMILAAQLAEQKPDLADMLKRKIEARTGKPVFDAGQESALPTMESGNQCRELPSIQSIRLYAGDIPNMPEYDGWIGLSLTRENERHIRHDITQPLPFPDNSVDAFQAEDVFEHIPYDRLVLVINEIFRVLKPGALFRLSVPDYGCDVLRERSIKSPDGDIIFDPGGSGTPENPGHVWFPRYEAVLALLQQSAFAINGTITFLHYYDQDGKGVTHQIDYSKGHIQRTPDFDDRVKTPYRPMSLVVDLVKAGITSENSTHKNAQQPLELKSQLIKMSFVMIVLNGMPFVEYALKAVYDEAHEIIIVEGAVEKCMFAANPDGSSVDGTVECIRSFPDPYRKIRLIQGKWPEKCEMQNAALEYVTGNYVWLVDSDEVYRKKDLAAVRTMLTNNPDITQINFIPDNFWKGFDYLFVSRHFFEPAHHFRRLFKYQPGSVFTSHRPPTMFWPGYTRSTEEINLVDGLTTRQMGIIPCHYSYVLDSQVKQKIELYRRYGWGDVWGVDLEKWYYEFFVKWTPENKNQLEKLYPVWTGSYNSYTVKFDREHPQVMSELIKQVSMQDTHISEDSLLPVIGNIFYMKKTIDSWNSIELDKPLQERNVIIRECIAADKPFWNIHVALAFIADKLKPKSYLEVGVRTGGSMVQVLGAARPEHVVAMDLWDGNYAGFPNYCDYTKKQLQTFQSRTGKSYNIEYIQGNSHDKLKELIRQGRKFDLITIDGDHSLEGAREDLEDAINLLSDSGAIVFDDIIHPSLPFLLGLVREIAAKYPDLKLLLNTTQDNGTAIFLKNIPLDILQSKCVKVAGDYDHGQNLTKVFCRFSPTNVLN